VGHAFGGYVGPIVVFVILLSLSGYMWVRSRRAPVDHRNVNDDWDENQLSRRAAAAADDTATTPAAPA